MSLINAIRHFKTITHHRHLVMKSCFKVGLYRQGLMHDLSKYSWTEFSVGAKYYQGTRSPNNREREEKGLSTAWLHHKGRNKHHYEYWIDYNVGSKDGEMPLCGMKMPVRYVVEMYIDRISACKNYLGDKYTDDAALNYYLRGHGHYVIHPDSDALLHKLLLMNAEKGEKETYRYIRKYVLKNKK